MKQILVISGKGGTGKTVITGALAFLMKNKVMVDCDVDAADFHLLSDPRIGETREFWSGHTAEIDPERCNRCGICRNICRFDAITEDFQVNGISCEGCGFCSHVCPESAITMEPNRSGDWYVSDTRFGKLVHARLGVAEENSGKLVSEIKKAALTLAEKERQDWILIDGPPGIGCPVIASLTGVDYVLLVTEPTLSGWHDARRVTGVAEKFDIPVLAVVNKYDLNIQMTETIEKECLEADIPVMGRISFDPSVVESVIHRKSIMEHSRSPVQREVRLMWENMEKHIKNKQEDH
jgi:MinD superfamily P-loop ATPase